MSDIDTESVEQTKPINTPPEVEPPDPVQEAVEEAQEIVENVQDVVWQANTPPGTPSLKDLKKED